LLFSSLAGIEFNIYYVLYLMLF